MLYSTSITNISKLPKDMKKYLIIRIPPKGFDIHKYSNLESKIELSPTKGLLLDLKYRGMSWSKFALRFKREMDTRPDMVEELANLKEALINGEDICIICVEGDNSECHRRLIGERMQSFGIKYEEYDFREKPQSYQLTFDI